MIIKQQLTKEIIDRHFKYFSPSLACFPEIYFPLIFKNKESIERHVAYICPLCAENFLILKKEGLFATSEFSREDFPPQNVGGSSKVLTCKKCNNEAGYKFDHELAKEVDRRAINYKAQFNIEEVKGYYNGSIEYKQEGIFAIDFPNKLKRKADPLKEWLANPLPVKEFQIKIKTEPVDNNKVAKALLKTAYLFCFLNWGYDFIFSSNGKKLRDFLNEADKDPSFLVGFWLESKNHKLQEVPIGLCAIDKPFEFKTFIVNIPIKRKNYSGIASIIIPSPGEQGWDKALHVKQNFQNNPNLEITISTYPSSMDIKRFNDYISTVKNS